MRNNDFISVLINTYGSPTTFMLFYILAAVAASSDSEDDTAEADGDSFSITNQDVGLVVTFEGSDLGGDPASNTFTGIVNSFSIAKIGDLSKANTVVLPKPTSLQAINDAADNIKGTPNPGNSKAAMKVLMPDDSPFPNLEYVGHSGKNFAIGFDDDDRFEMKGGKDTVYASKGSDTMLGGSGSDTFNAAYIKQSTNINLKTGNATFGDHTTTLSSVENAIGGTKGDRMVGNAKANVLQGRNGNDVMIGNGGNDRMEGGNGKDILKGGSGRDVLNGGAANDRMFGGGGADKFVFNGKAGAQNGTDRIKDWDTGLDKIQIKGGQLSEVTVSRSSGNTTVTYDEGKIIIEDVSLTKGDIDFLF